jgi:Smg protein
MNARYSDVLARLRERFPSSEASPADVAAFLSSEGFDRRQIGEILGLLFPHLGGVADPRAAGVAAVRIMGPHERGRFAPDAWGHLLTLTGSGVLTPLELEHVIERALTHVDGRIALDDLRSLLEGSGYDDRGHSGEQPTVH